MFREVTLPVVGKTVLRLGFAGNYGADSALVRKAANRGVNYWVWTPRFKTVTPVLREILRSERDQHVVAVLGTAYTAGMVRRGVDKALRELGTDHVDVWQLSWLGIGSALTEGVAEALLDVKKAGKVRAIGTSIHDRPRAGRRAADSILDLLMIRYNAAHPGAEQDIFPHLAARNPAVVSYTATSWRQLLQPLGIEMPPWPGEGSIPPLTAALCYRFCLSSPHVHVALMGPSSEAHLEENLAALAAGPLPPDQEAWIREYGKKVRSRKKIPFI